MFRTGAVQYIIMSNTGGVIERLVLRRKGSGGEAGSVHSEMRFIGDGLLPQIMSLQKVIAAHLPDPEIFRLDAEAYWRKNFQTGESVIGVFAGDELIAYGAVYVPAPGADNFGVDIGLDRRSLETFAHLETTAVHPAYRGNGLQKKLMAVMMDALRRRGYHHLGCTVSPLNHHSVTNIFHHRFVIRALKSKFGGLLRYVMYRDVTAKKPVYTKGRQLIDAKDVAAQIKLLEEGYVGFDYNETSHGFRIWYGR